MFSVIIPLYNKEELILRTVYSVLTQSFKEFEVVIVNDGSSDNSVQLLEENIVDTRVRIVHQKNQGVSAARNRGVAEAKYEYLAFLDADDEWLPGYLAKVKEAINLFSDAGLFITPALHRSILTGEGSYHIEHKFKNKIIEIDYFKDPKKLGGQTSGIVVSKFHFNNLVQNYEGGGFPLGLNLNEDWTCFQSLAFISKSIYIGYSLSIRNIEVKGQLVDLSDNGYDMRMNKSPQYLNITFRNFVKSKSRSRSFVNFRKHEIRSFVSFFLRRGKDVSDISRFIKNLDPESLKLFPSYEIALYKKSNSKLFIFLYLGLSKAFWKFKNVIGQV